jgi:hypothetical protein
MVLHHPLKEHMALTKAHRKAILSSIQIAQGDEKLFLLA